MFGYVIPNQAALDDEAKARYRTAYCGLCRRIGALHGLRRCCKSDGRHGVSR